MTVSCDQEARTCTSSLFPNKLYRCWEKLQGISVHCVLGPLCRDLASASETAVRRWLARYCGNGLFATEMTLAACWKILRCCESAFSTLRLCNNVWGIICCGEVMIDCPSHATDMKDFCFLRASVMAPMLLVRADCQHL